MRRSIPITLILIILLLASISCSTIMVLQESVPPALTLEQDENVMLVVNNFDYVNSPAIKEKNRPVYSSGINSFYDGLLNSLAGSDYINVKQYDKLRVPDATIKPSGRLDPGYVSELCSVTGAGLLLTIDSLYIDFDWQTEVIEEEDGSKSKTKYFYIQVSPYLTLYESNGAVADNDAPFFEQPFTSRPTLSGLITIKPALTRATENVMVLSNEAGHYYGSKFFETYVPVTYKVYHQEPFVQAYRFMLDRRWADAIRDLLPLAESPDKKIAKRAAHNLYVAYRGIGDFESAQTWFNRARK